MQSITVYTKLPPNIHERVKTDAEKDGRSMSNFLRRIVISWYDQDDFQKDILKDIKHD
jgi:hypothetical protein